MPGTPLVPASMRGAHPRSVAYRRRPLDSGLEAPLTIAFRADDDPTVKPTFLALARRIAAEEGEHALPGGAP